MDETLRSCFIHVLMQSGYSHWGSSTHPLPQRSPSHQKKQVSLCWWLPLWWFVWAACVLRHHCEHQHSPHVHTSRGRSPVTKNIIANIGLRDMVADCMADHLRHKTLALWTSVFATCLQTAWQDRLRHKTLPLRTSSLRYVLADCTVDYLQCKMLALWIPVFWECFYIVWQITSSTTSSQWTQGVLYLFTHSIIRSPLIQNTKVNKRYSVHLSHIA